MWSSILEVLNPHEAIRSYWQRQQVRKGIRFYLPTTGDTRVVEKFAFLPVKCNGEVRWFVRVKYHQTYQYDHWHNDYFMW